MSRSRTPSTSRLAATLLAFACSGVRVVVQDPEGRPIAGAAVVRWTPSVGGPDGAPVAVTDARGEARVPWFPQEPWWPLVTSAALTKHDHSAFTLHGPVHTQRRLELRRPLGCVRSRRRSQRAAHSRRHDDGRGGQRGAPHGFAFDAPAGSCGRTYQHWPAVTSWPPRSSISSTSSLGLPMSSPSAFSRTSPAPGQAASAERAVTLSTTAPGSSRSTRPEAVHSSSDQWYATVSLVIVR